MLSTRTEPEGPSALDSSTTHSVLSNLEEDENVSITGSLLSKSESQSVLLFPGAPATLRQEDPIKRVVADEKMKALVGKETEKSWLLGSAGVYHLRITRASAATAHCKGTVAVIKQDTGESLWQLGAWRSDKGGVDESFAIPITEKCIVCVTMQAHHFCSSVVPLGRSVARVCITQSASLIKGRFPLRTGSSQPAKSLSFCNQDCSIEFTKAVPDHTKPWDDECFDDPLVVLLVKAISQVICRKAP